MDTTENLHILTLTFMTLRSTIQRTIGINLSVFCLSHRQNANFTEYSNLHILTLIYMTSLSPNPIGTTLLVSDAGFLFVSGVKYTSFMYSLFLSC